MNENTEVTTTEAPEQLGPEVMHTPRADVLELADGYQVRVDLPGCAEDDIQLDLEAGVLTLRAAQGALPEVGDGYEAVHGETTPGVFQRKFQLPEDLDLEKVEASLRHGTLTISLPRQASTSRRIQVITAGDEPKALDS